MRSSSNFTPQLPKSLLFIGPPGSGKTTFALQIPNCGVIDCDDNLGGPMRWLRLQGLSVDFKYDTPLRDANDKPIPREQQFTQLCKILDEMEADPTITTVVIDSLSSLVEILFIHVLQQLKRPISPDIRTADKKFEYEDWAAFGNILRKLIFKIKASKRLIITAHIKVDQDEMTKILYRFINCPGAIKDYLSGWFEEAWEFYIHTQGVPPNEKAIRKIRTVPEARSVTLGLKTAAGLPATMDADAKIILAKLNA
jgi:hypothetical protein